VQEIHTSKPLAGCEIDSLTKDPLNLLAWPRKTGGWKLIQPTSYIYLLFSYLLEILNSGSDILNEEFVHLSRLSLWVSAIY
jgi:hypothetical protein